MKEEIALEDSSILFSEKNMIGPTIKTIEKTADEMFEKLGYKKFNKKHDFENIKYYKDDDNILYFDEKDKSFYKSGEYDAMCNDITMQELQAINKKCQELGWVKR